MTRTIIPAFVLAGVAAAALGFAASHYLDNGRMQKLETERDRARDCRLSGTTLPPCPVAYRNTQIMWRTKVETRPVRDPAEAERTAALAADLAHAQRIIRTMETQMAFRRATGRGPFSYHMQNGSLARPYDTAARCPAGTTVEYSATPIQRGMIAWRSGDPNVCYVRIAQRR